MRVFSYHNKRIMRRILLIVLIAAAALAVLIVCRFAYLGRFVKYDSDGAHLDYGQKLSPTMTDPVESEAGSFPFETIVDPGDPDTTELAEKQLSGYYITTEMLAKDVDAVREALAQSDGYNTVMIDVKSVYGNFYYSSKLSGAVQSSADIHAVDALIAELTDQKDLTVIARVPAFSDPNYALAHQQQGIPLWSGALWTDENGCYWMNPYSNDVQGWLSSIAIELEDLGFDEVLFDNFYFPVSDNIGWNDPDVTTRDAIMDAAESIAANLSGNRIRVDYGTDDPEIAAFAARAFAVRSEPADAATLAEDMAGVFDDTAASLVFLTDSHDTRFESCGVLRPLISEYTE